MSTRDDILALEARVGESIIGQREVVRRIVLGLLANGHVLLEGLPGLAKTRAVKALARALAADMNRVQFTPDLLPSDVTGTEVYTAETNSFRFDEGPLFANLVLADEINRAPAKVQAALLEAMEERQVTVAGTTHALPRLFMVLATQNPIEQEGTYPLPEAQLDRFLLHIYVDYPSPEEERAILRLVRSEESGSAAEQTPTPQEAIAAAKQAIHGVQVSEAIEQYIVDLVVATREPPEALQGLIELGGSPRASLALDRCARARAWLEGRDHVLPDDVRDVAPSVLRHRLRLSYEAAAQGLTTSAVIDRLLEHVAVS